MGTHLQLEKEMEQQGLTGKKVIIGGEGFDKVITGSVAIGPTVACLHPKLLTRGVEIVAYDTNTDPVYVAARPDVTADEDPDTGGFRLLPGASVFFPALEAGNICLVSQSAGFIGFLGY